MGLSKDKIDLLLKLVASSQEDCLDCDHCFEHIAEFAEAHLTGQTIPEALKTVQVHLESCPCCADEYQTLVAALRSLPLDEA